MGKKKINVAILFGGKSAEHEVSLQSAKNVIDAIDKDKYNPILIGIDKAGKWLLNEHSKFLLHTDNPKLIKLNQASDSIAIVPQSQGKIFNLVRRQSDISIDVVFPILHGPFGEDGTVQGLLKLANVPYVGAGVLGSAVGMDKDVMKRLLREAGLPVVKFLKLNSTDSMPSFISASKAIGNPFFVKPANMGSSIGVHKVKNQTEYKKALKSAFQYDKKILLEEYIDGREIECAILGNENPIASVPGEVITNHEFYSYEAKYIDKQGAVLEIPAKISNIVAKKIQQLAIQAFKTLSCEGMGRVDFFLTKNNKIIVDELNSIPGFTKISMYPKLWEASGISYTELIDRLIQLGIERFHIETKLSSNYIG